MQFRYYMAFSNSVVSGLHRWAEHRTASPNMALYTIAQEKMLQQTAVARWL